MDSQLAMAIHALCLMAISPSPVSSAEMARSIGTNPSYLRKILNELKKAGLIDSRQGKSGFSLQDEPASISLYRIYQALHPRNDPLFLLHKNPDCDCSVGANITQVLDQTFFRIEQTIQHELEGISLADILQELTCASCPMENCTCSPCTCSFERLYPFHAAKKENR